MSTLQLGLDSFGDITVDDSGQPLAMDEVIRNIIAEAELADRLGLSYFGLGEHHRADFAVSATSTVLSAIAARTQNIHVGSSVTILSSEDPVRVYEQYATIDAISSGRAEVTLGRGSFIESFPLFGYDLNHYDELFEEKLDLFARLLTEDAITWQGTQRAPLFDQQVYPKTASGRLPTWIAIVGSPESVIRAAQYGFPMKLAIIGGALARFRPFVDLYYDTLAQVGHSPQPVAAHSPGYVAETDEKAREEFWPYYREHFGRISLERGWPQVLTPERFDAEIRGGALFVGSPETVAKKLAQDAKTLGLQRFDLKYANGAMPHSLLLKSIELYATEVVPRVHEILSSPEPVAP